MSPEEKPQHTASDIAPAAGVTPPPKPEEAKTPAEIRTEIDQTREELGDTVEALAEKTDVKAQAKAKVEDVKTQAKAKVEEVKAKAAEAAPESPQEGVQQAQTLVKQNPKPAAIAGVALALIVLWRLLRR
jgi:ElaB/YqjD/DUF883 family membrane-anchored ribosome-binding protein